MRQKILIIASIIHNPDVLFLDEPIAGLDANSVMVFKELLHQLAKNGKTIFYSSHMMDVVEKISDRIVLIDQGIIAADGNFDTLNSTSQYGSLEELFNKVTGTDNHEEIAKSIIETISGDDVWKN
jgi:ABC-2 type transport system ATP-binding protein